MSCQSQFSTQVQAEGSTQLIRFLSFNFCISRETLIVTYFVHFPDIEIKMGKRKNQPLIDSESDSNNDSGSDLDSVSLIEFLIRKNYAFSHEMYHHLS